MGEPTWTLSAHATNVLRERAIDPDWIAWVLQAPLQVDADQVDPALPHALAPIDDRDGRVLRVVYRTSADYESVIVGEAGS